MPSGMPRVALNCWRGGGTKMELLIRIVDKQPATSTMHETASQWGDVITVCADGWQWSAAELTNPDWIIVRAAITEIEVGALLEGFRPGEPKYRRRLGVNPKDLTAGDSLTRDQLMARIF